MTDIFFVYCPESGFDCFLTLDAALDEANERIQGYLGDAWSEEVTGVCAGKITHKVKMCDQVFPDGEIDEEGYDERGDYWDPDCDYKCNYKMLPADVQGGPVAFCEDAALTIAERTFSEEVGEQLARDIIQFAQRLHSLYAAPKPTEQQPDVTQLVEALEAVMEFGCDPKSNRGRWALEKAESALATYRNQGGDL